MAAEITGPILETANLYSISEARFEGYHLLCKTNCIGADTPLIRAKLIIEEQRFLMWASIHQLVVGGAHASDRPKNWKANSLLENPVIEKVVKKALLAIKLNSEALCAIFKKYGFHKRNEVTSLKPTIITKPGPILLARYTRTKNQISKKQANRRKSSGDSLRKRVSCGKRMGFVPGDKEKIDKCLLDFTNFNKSL